MKKNCIYALNIFFMSHNIYGLFGKKKKSKIKKKLNLNCKPYD